MYSDVFLIAMRLTAILLSLSLHNAFTLNEKGVNVDKIITYKSEKSSTSCWLVLRCTQYRQVTVTNYRCKAGYRTTDNYGCPHAICDGDINPEACNKVYTTSHIVGIDGSTKYSSGGKCDDDNPGTCLDCNPGFFNSRERCRMCTAITNCDLEECRSSTDQTCTRCEGVEQELPGHRAYVHSANRKTCTKACSWRSDSTRCYPGTCANEFARNCRCLAGFSGTHCETISTKPIMSYNILRLTAANGDTSEAPPNINSGQSQDTSWSNIPSPSSVYYKFTADYRITQPEPKHAFIVGFRAGIVSASATFIIKRGGHTTSSKSISCSGASRDNPDTDAYHCEGNPSPSSLLLLPFRHLDVIEFSYEAKNGGYVKVRNKENNVLSTHYYNGATRTNSFTMTIDVENPYHCTGTTTCVDSMLTTPNLIKASTINLRWSEWKDDDAGVDHYLIEVYELHAVGNELKDKKRVKTETVPSSTNTYSVTLTEAGIYSVILSAYDKAGNHRSTRRLLIYDGTSSVTTQSTSKLQITTASTTASEWQTTSSHVSVDWTGRYINTLHHSNKWLLGVASISSIKSLYDDHEGDRTVSPINNINGTVRFTTSFKVDHNGGSTIEASPVESDFTTQGLSQSQTISPSLNDGDTLRFWVRAYDIMSNMKEESVTVHIDTSPPVIENLWLTRGERLNISVHRIEELSEMTMEWIAYDEHSGLETVSWRVVDKFEGKNIVHGIQHIRTQGETPNLERCKVVYSSTLRGANCYCTPAKGCYHRNFLVKPEVIDSSQSHGGIFSDKYKGVHDSDYHIEVTVTNHAKLTTKKEFKITIDSSPPHPGAVHDGQTGHPEVDYQDSLDIHANWDGFFDRESGVKFYQYKFGPSCLNASDFGLDDPSLQVNEIYSTSTSWTAPSIGKYHVTVVAYNRALEPSDPICSDGVTIDTTPPNLSEVAVAHSRVMEGLVKTSDGSVWVIDKERRRSLISSPGPECRLRSTSIDVVALSHFPRRHSKDESYMAINNVDCTTYIAFPSRFISTFYLYKETHLFVNWTGSDSESGIYDYELGLITDPSGEAAPDILPYTSSHHHPQYQGYHPGLSEGQQFYIAVKAINKAGLSVTKVLGPAIVHTIAPAFIGKITVNLDGGYLVGQWTGISFTDPEAEYLQYQVAVGTKDMGSSTIPFESLKPGGSCSLTSPPTCTAIAIKDLHWGLHHSHTYFMSVRVTNIVGLSTVVVSELYVHDVRLPSRGVVLDVVPYNEESLFAISKYEDSDHQISTTSLTARWYGFDNGLHSVTYNVAIGSSPTKSDVIEMIAVGNDLEHEFTGLNLKENRKYYVIVEAKSGAGKTTVSSDGVTVVRQNAGMSNVTVRDGPGCRDISDDLENDHNQLDCKKDRIYQVSSSTYAANWRRNDSDRGRYPDVYWSLQQKLPHSVDIWETVRDFEHLGTSESILAGGLSLEPGYTYRAAVKFCAVRVCSVPTHSDGVTVIPHPPKTGSISLQYEEKGDTSNIHVTMDRYKDPDIMVLSKAYDVMDRYEWGLSDNSHSSRLLVAWQEVDASSISTDGHKITFTVTLRKHLDFTKCRRFAIKGYNKMGLTTVSSRDIKNCTAYDPDLIVPGLVVDAVGLSKSTDLGYSIKLQKNNIWGIADADYTPYKNILSAVWPTLRHRNYTWAVVSGDKINPTSHYKRESIMTVSDPCTIPDVVKCGRTENEYINIEFHSASYLRHGKRFYICVHADEMNSEFEKWTAQLAEVNACSDGITVDLTAPEAGTVTVEGLNKYSVQVSTTEVQFKWTGFTDVEEEGSISHSSGISHYQVALGTVPGGQDVCKFNNVGLVNHITLHSLSINSGSLLFVSVKACDFVNKTIMAVSEGFLVDSSPPVVTGRQLQIADRYITSTVVHVCWTGVFLDEESGLDIFLIALGTKPGYDDITKYIYTYQTCEDVDTLDSVMEGHQYYITVKGYNKAGLYTQISSRPLVVATTPPPSGHVYDGRIEMATSDNRDKDFVKSTSGMGAFWDGFDDPHSLIIMFKIKIGTCPGCDDKLKEFEYGTRKDIVFEHVYFSPGTKYYTTVTACNAANFCSSSTSDGIIVDNTAPVPGKVDDGTGDVDIQYQNSRTFIGCKWRGFYDPESELDHYEWHVGTTRGGDEILTARSAALEELAFHTLTSDQVLPVGQRLYTTVRAYNKAGSYTEVTSNGFMVDNDPPTIVISPTMIPGLGSAVSMTTVSRTTLNVRWEFKDIESFIERQYLSISSHNHGEFQRSAIMVPGFISEYIYTGLDLHDGSRYKVKATACNMAGLCSSDVTQEVLIDSSKPKTGTLAIETDHAAQLSRHQSGWMTWTSNTLKLAWLGFSDLHSGVDHYIVTVGSQPFQTNLNEGGVPIQIPHESEGVSKGDEGTVQTVTVPTHILSEKQFVFVTIWAVNGVGLKSDPYHGQLILEGDGVLRLVRRCQPYNCEGHCVCAVQDGACETSDGCVSLTNVRINVSIEGGPNSILSVNDVINFTLPLDATDVDFSPLDTVMAATWSVTTDQGKAVLRYEYSIGECDKTNPQGVFNVVTERFWFDAGQETSAILSLPKDRSLSSGTTYCFFVRAWYDASNYSIFKSNGVNIDVVSPSVAHKFGFSVKEYKYQGSNKDIDYQTNKEKLFIDWGNVFFDGHSSILKYRVYISTTPGGHSIHESSDLTTTSYTATGLNLEPDTVYYSSVLAYNKAGLVSWAYSDGVQVDVVPPVAGVVNDGQDIHNVDYQSSPTKVSASWSGFSDSDSAIIKYHWCVGTVNDTTDCSILDWQDTGLHTSFETRLLSSLSIGTTIWNKVYAVDTVGQTSNVGISNGVKLDTSAPEPKSLAYLGDNLLKNPSFEVDAIIGGTTNCSLVNPTSWDTDSESCIKIVSPQSPLAKHGNRFVSVSGTIKQTVTDLDIGRQYKLLIHTGYPQTISNRHRTVEGSVSIAGDSFTFNLDPNLCKGTCDTTGDSVILWNKHTYRFTARETTSVLEISSASRSMEFVLDHVILQTVDYGSSSNSGGTENHLIVHSVFLSHWSSLHASWHFQDVESPITEYKWAIGTVEGGTQLQGYRNVGRNTQSTAINLQLSHNSTVYISVMATNAAGLTTVSHSDPIRVDMTPPNLHYVNDGPVWDDDFQSSSVVVVNWKVDDDESGIHYCDWAVGRTKGMSDVRRFERVPPGQSTARHDIINIIDSNSITVYTTVRCFNQAGLVTEATTDGVMVVLESDVKQKPVPGFTILKEEMSVYGQRGICHQSQYVVRLGWEHPNLKLKSVVVGLEGQNITYQNSISNNLDFTSAKLSGLSLTPRTTYETYSFPVDVLEIPGEITSVNFTVHGIPPKLSTSGDVTVTRDGDELTLSWESVFTSHRSHLIYEVQIGSVVGGADITDTFLTKEGQVKLNLTPSHTNGNNIVLSVAAIDPCGRATFYSKQIRLDT